MTLLPSTSTTIPVSNKTYLPSSLIFLFACKHFFRPFLARQPVQQDRVRAHPETFRRPSQQQQQPQQQHNRVRIESQQQVPLEEAPAEEEEEEVETPVPTRHRVPVGSRQPVQEVVQTSTEAEVSSTTSKVFK
jgi:hypothetical protein